MPCLHTASYSMALDFGIWHTQLKKMFFDTEHRRPCEIVVLGQNFLPYILATERKPEKCSCSGPLSQFKRIKLCPSNMCLQKSVNTLTSWKKTSVPIGTSHTIRVPASSPICICYHHHMVLSKCNCAYSYECCRVTSSYVLAPLWSCFFKQNSGLCMYYVCMQICMYECMYLSIYLSMIYLSIIYHLSAG